ncbi:hypothetical protein FACS1894217_06350 [Clostridia bacterium]|nr:hypothetical protein FACS1894217_06350 [Clostridia bacterium]
MKTLDEVFAGFDRISERNTARVLDAFRRHRVSDSHFAGTTGYGYSDLGRDNLERVFADVMGAESALVRVQFACGTHAIACALFGAVKSGAVLLSATGAPYDTLRGVVAGKPGSLQDYGVGYRELGLLSDGTPDLRGLAVAAREVAAVFIQRSRGYASRPAIDINTLESMVKVIREVNQSAVIVVDNCYCEFVDVREPPMVGADFTAGSLIKNPGGGLAPSGGYVAGRADLVERAAARLTAPGLGAEVGSSLGQNRLLYQGLFTAPHAVAQALKTVAYAAYILEERGFQTEPRYFETRADIIQTLFLGEPQRLLAFCKGIQSGSPIDSFLKPEPWDMPGYDCPVVMAAGTFIQGGSLELTCDAPMREPYAVYIQGGLTFEAGKYAIDRAVKNL